LSLIPWGTKKEQAERRVQQSIESKRSQQAADEGLARELVYSYKWQAEKAPQWFRGVMDKLAKKYGQKYADDIRSLMTIVKNENNQEGER